MQGIAAHIGSRRPSLVELPPHGALPPGQVLCRTLELGVCGTDREILHSERPWTPPDSAFLVLGHECLARVEEVSADCGPSALGTPLRPGDLVVPVVRRASVESPRRPDTLPFGVFTERGIVEEHGFSIPFWHDEPRHLFPAPPDATRVAVLTEPLAVAEKGVNEALALQRGRMGSDCWPEADQTAGCVPTAATWADDGSATIAAEAGVAALHRTPPRALDAPPRVLVTGLGPIGFAAVLASRVRGWPTTIYGRDAPDSFRAELAQRLGARYVAPQHGWRIPADVEAHGYDLVLECTGSDEVMLEASRATASLGIIVWLGSTRVPQPAERNVQRLMRDGLLRNHLHVACVNAAGRDFEQALAHLAAWYRTQPDAVEAIITERVTPNESLWHYEHRRTQGIKTVLMYE